MAITLAPSYNQPTVTSGACSSGAAASTIISGSAGWYREKRLSVAEAAAGASQTSTNNLDLANSTHYAYTAMPDAQTFGSNAGQYVESVIKPGGTTQAARWPFAFDIVTSSPSVAWRMNAPAANPSVGRILVDGLAITEDTANATATAGSGYYVKLVFPDSRSRRITVYGAGNIIGRWGGAAVESGYSITKPSATPIMAVIGDSYVHGAGGVGAVDTFAWRVASELGYTGWMGGGIGGTGWIQTINSESVSIFDGRTALVTSLAPEAILIAGGRNDASYSAAAIQAAVEAHIDALRAALPSVKIGVTRTCTNGSTTTIGAIAAACASRGVRFFDIDIDALPKQVDTIHPTLAGHKTFASALAAAWSEVAGTLATATPAVTVAAPISSWSGTATAPTFTGSLTATTPAVAAAVPMSSWSGTSGAPGVVGTFTANAPTVAVAVPTAAWSGTGTAPTFTGTFTANTPTATVAVPTTAWSGTATVPTFAGTLTTTTPAVSIAKPAASWAGAATVPQFTGSLTGNTPAVAIAVPLASWAGTATPPGGGDLTASTPGVTIAVPVSGWVGTTAVPVYSGLVGADAPAVLVSVPISTWVGLTSAPGVFVATLPGVTIGIPASAWMGLVGAAPDQRDLTITLSPPRQHPATLGPPTAHPLRIAEPIGYPFTLGPPT